MEASAQPVMQSLRVRDFAQGRRHVFESGGGQILRAKGAEIF